MIFVKDSKLWHHHRLKNFLNKNIIDIGIDIKYGEKGGYVQNEPANNSNGKKI